MSSAPGQRAEVLLKELPLATYTGVVFSEPLLTFVIDMGSIKKPPSII